MANFYASYPFVGSGGGAGTVTSVGLADGSSAPIYSISGSPVTGSGTLTFTLNTEPANEVFAGPASGPDAEPTFRALVTADLPAGTGTVTSVGLSDSSITPIFTISGSPVTTSGTLDIALNTEPANFVFAGPTTGVDAEPTFRALVAADIPVPTGAPNTFAGFDASGNLENIPNWAFDPVTDGAQVNIPIDPPDITSYSVLHRFSEELNPSQPSPNNSNILIQFGMDIDPGNSGFGVGSAGLGGRVLDLFMSARTTSVNGSVDMINSNISLGDNALTGGSVIGVNNLNLNTDIQTGFTVTQNTVGVNLNTHFDLGSTTNGFLGFNSDLEVNGSINNNFIHFNAGGNFNPSNAFTGALNGFSFAGNVTGSVGNINGFADFANVQSGATLTNGYSSIVCNPQIQTGSTVNNVQLINLNPNAAAGTITNDFTGININLGSVIMDRQKIGLSVGEGATYLQSVWDTSVIPTSGGEFQLNLVGGQFTIAAGFPVTGGAFGFGNNIGPSLFFADDMPVDSTGVDLGFSINGLVNQIAGASGKTMKTVNYMTAGAGVNNASTGGTITDLTMFRAIGLLPGAGTLNVTNMYGFKVDPVFDLIGATNPWGVYVASTTADNWFAKNVVIGGSTGHPTGSFALDVTGAMRTDTALVLEDPGAGTDAITLQAPTLAAPYSFTLPVDGGTSGYVLSTDGSGNTSWVTAGGTGTVTSVSVVTANGVSGSVATATTTPAITLTLGAITPSSVAAVGTVTGSNLSGTNTGDITLGTANGLSLVGQALSLGLSSTSTTGALSSTDWNTFNGKQAAGNYITALTGDVTASGPGSSAATLATVNGNVGSFTLSNITVNAKGLITAASSTATGNLTDAGTDGITVTGGTGAVIGSGTSISQHVSDSTHNGYLSSTDWSTFNGKQAAGNYITALTGDATASGPGSAALTLATVNSNTGSFGSATSIPVVTVNGKGLITAVTTATPNTSAARAINAQTGTTYTFALTDGSNNGNDPLVTASNGSAQTYTVPDNATVAFPTGSQIDIIQLGSGKVTIAAAGGVTINSQGGNLAIGAQYVGVSLIKTATNTWVLIGNLQA